MVAGELLPPLTGRKPLRVLHCPEIVGDMPGGVSNLLHLFGASDKYGYALKAYAPKSVTTRDVMRLSEGRLARLRIDSGTAAEIGWTADGKD